MRCIPRGRQQTPVNTADLNGSRRPATLDSGLFGLGDRDGERAVVEPRMQDTRTGDARQRDRPVGSCGDTAGRERHYQDRDQIRERRAVSLGPKGQEGVPPTFSRIRRGSTAMARKPPPPHEKGAPRTPGSGRKKGTLNKKTVALWEVMAAGLQISFDSICTWICGFLGSEVMRDNQLIVTAGCRTNPRSATPWGDFATRVSSLGRAIHRRPSSAAQTIPIRERARAVGHRGWRLRRRMPAL